MGGLLTYGNKKYEKLDSKIREILPYLFQGYHELLKLVDQDANAFNSYLVYNFKNKLNIFIFFKVNNL